MTTAATNNATDRSRVDRAAQPPPPPSDSSAALHATLNDLAHSMTALEDRYRLAGIAWHRVPLPARERPELSSTAHAGARTARELFEREPGTNSGPRDITHRLQDAVADMRREVRAGRGAGVGRRLDEARALRAALEGKLGAAEGAAADGVRLGRRFKLVARGRKEEMEEGVRRWIETLPGVRRLTGDDKTVADHIWYDMYYGTQDGFEEDEEDEEESDSEMTDADMTDADLNESDDSDGDSY